MERLTFEGNFCDIAQCREIPCPYNGACSQRKVWERLKAYEDKGLEPDEVTALQKDWSDLCTVIGECGGIDRLRELAEAYKGGRLVVLPCKVGDTVYEVTSRKTIREYRVKAIRVELFCTFIEWDIVAGFVDKSIFGVPVDELGKTVFLTRDEAEKALEAMKCAGYGIGAHSAESASKWAKSATACQTERAYAQIAVLQKTMARLYPTGRKNRMTTMAEYIDREELIRDIISDMDLFMGTPEDVQKHDEQCIRAISYIESATGADVVPVVHGRWEWLGPNRLVADCMCGTCSACKVRSKYIVNTMLCPNCGAKMDIKDGGDKQRLIDADALIGKFNEKVDMTERLVNERTAERFATFCALADSVEEMPTVDAEVVVRCKDCKYSTLPSELTKRYGVPGTLTCHNRYSPCNRRNVGGNDFCSYGERKDYIEN